MSAFRDLDSHVAGEEVNSSFAQVASDDAHFRASHKNEFDNEEEARVLRQIFDDAKVHHIHCTCRVA